MSFPVTYFCLYATALVSAYAANDQLVDLPSNQTDGLTSNQKFEPELGQQGVTEIGEKNDQTRSVQDGSPNIQKVGPKRTPSNVSPGSAQRFGLGSAQQDGLPSEWISKIFSDAMWTYAPHSESNSTCNLQAGLYLQHISNNTYWAIRMLDASLITPSGIIGGAGQQFGHPDQCIHTQIPLTDFRTKYCLPSAQLSPFKELYPDFYNKRTRDWPQDVKNKSVWDFLRPRDQLIRFTRHAFSWGLCIPESCSAQDVQTSLNDTLSQAFAKHRIHVQVNLTDLQCYSASEEKSRQMPLAGYLWTYVWYALIGLSALGTIVDYQFKEHGDSQKEEKSEPRHLNRKKTALNLIPLKWVQDQESKKWNFFLPFSFRRNAHNLLSKDSKQNADQIELWDGMKGLAIGGTLIFHREGIGFSRAKNLEYVEGTLRSISFGWITASMNILDTFFFVSGFLLARSVIKILNKNKTPNFISMIVNRLWRIYPMYLMIIAFTIWVQPYIGEGPLWKSYADTEAQICRQYWWQNILFISTLYTEGNKLCIPSSWYLSTDFQLYLLSLVLIFIVTKCPAWRKHILIVAFVVAHLVPSIVTYLEREPSMWILSVKGLRADLNNDYLRKMYCPFYMRMGPYIYGVCAAYLTDHFVKKKFKFSVAQKTKIFITSVVSTFALFYIGAALFFVPERVFNSTVWEHVVFVIPYRLVYCSVLAISVIIEMCGGYGAVSDFFCNPIWVTWGRMSYHMYLWNFLVISWDVFLAQSLTHYNMYTFVLRTIGDLGMVSLISFFTHTLLEPLVTDFRKRFLPK